MKQENIYQTFEIEYKELNECPKEEHKHSFFELVYIVYGMGRQLINNESFNYEAGQMFLITPDDTHCFEVQNTTGFLFIRFSNIYIQSKTIDKSQVKRLEFILENANHRPGCILRNKSDKRFVRSLVDVILREYAANDLFSNELTIQLINTLIVIISRNISRCMPDNIRIDSQDKIIDIITYIQNNIHNPKKIKSTVISERFNLSVFYLGRYFKKHTEQTLQQYILAYRLRLIEIRLLHSQMRINEIAFELGFSDESHLVKFFKKYKGVSPGEYRKSRQITDYL